MDQYTKLKLLEENLCDFRLGKEKLDMMQKTIHWKNNFVKLDFIKIKNYL